MVQIASFICDNGNELRLSVLCVLGTQHSKSGQIWETFQVTLHNTRQCRVWCTAHWPAMYGQASWLWLLPEADLHSASHRPDGATDAGRHPQSSNWPSLKLKSKTHHSCLSPLSEGKARGRLSLRVLFWRHSSGLVSLPCCGVSLCSHSIPRS